MKHGSYADIQAEVHVIAAMMDTTLREETEDIDLSLFQSKEPREVASKIWVNRYKDGVTPKIMLNEFQGNTNILDYIAVVLRLTISKPELAHYIKRLKLAKARSIYADYGFELLALANKDDVELEQLEKLSHNVPTIQDDSKSPLFIAPEQYAGEFFYNLMERVKNPDTALGIQFKNFPELNSTFMGLRGGDLLMVCAQSGHGKTAIALNLAKDIAVDQENILYYLNAEMNVDELSSRIISNMTNVPTTELMTGRIQAPVMEVLEHISNETDRLGKANLYLSRIPTMTIRSIRKGYTQLSRVGKKPDIMVIDYIGRMELEEPTNGLSEWQRLYELSEDIKTMAVELNIPIIVLAQLNGDGKIEGAKKMKNACDGVLFFEPITDEMAEEESKYMNENQQRKANYKIVKYKVRRNDNSKPIYMQFIRDKQRVKEIE